MRQLGDHELERFVLPVLLTEAASTDDLPNVERGL